VNVIDDCLLTWLTVNNPSNEPVPLWMRQFGYDSAGVIYAPVMFSDQPIEVTAPQAKADGIIPVVHLEHVYVPVAWMLSRFPSRELQVRAEIMTRILETSLETGDTTGTVMHWLTFPESQPGLEEWHRTNGVTPDGTVYSAAALADVESKIMAMAKEEGIKIEIKFDRVYAPALWLATKNPARRELLLSIEQRIREEMELHK
jgi:hypothetical protein